MSMNEKCCLGKVLKVIDVLQKNAKKFDCVSEGCTKPFLGNMGSVECFNTRPVTFYRCSGDLFTLPYTSNGVSLESSVFRIEDVEDCCAVVTILAPNPNTEDPYRPYINTNQFATINLNCVCVLQCLPDVIIDCQ